MSSATTEEKLKNIAVNPSLHKRVKKLSADVEKPIVDLADEAFTDLLKKYGTPATAAA